jgi:putative 4-mercaptohistidine N1-methyltranferase
MANLYESPRLLDEYLLFHYGEPEEVLPWGFGPREALGFPVRTVTAFLEGREFSRALDLGCAVGRSALEMTRFCDEVVAVDYSGSFIAAAERLRSEGSVPYSCHEEGVRRQELTARLPHGCRTERVSFEQGDAMNLRADIGDFDLVHAANLLCRLPAPDLLLKRLPALVRPGGLLIITTPCTWLEEFTPPGNWPPGSTFDWLRASLEPDFQLEKRTDLPFLIRETARKYQWSVALGTAWIRS